MEDARPLDQLTRVDPDAPLLVAVTEPARQGELLMTRATREGRRGIALIDLMRCLLLPMASKLRGTLIANEIPRLLDIIVPGFDAFVHRWYPGFRRPGTLLLPLSVRIPVLAGVARVAREPNRWAESLLDAVAEIERPRLVACLGGLMAGRAWPHDPVQTGACVFR